MDAVLGCILRCTVRPKTTNWRDGAIEQPIPRWPEVADMQANK
jgi:hypothetical protein